MDLKIEFGKKIKKLRESLFLSQEAFAEKIGIQRNTLSRIENGNNFVSADTLEKIREVSNVDYKELFNFNTNSGHSPKKALETRLLELSEKEAEFFISTIENYLKLKN